MADSFASNFDANSVASDEAVLQTNILIESFAALRLSVGLLGQFIIEWKNGTGHTNTTNYCNPAEHAHRGLTILR